MTTGRFVLLSCILLGVPFAALATGAQDAAQDEADDLADARGKLWLRESGENQFPGGYLTTFPPAENNTTQEVELQQSGVSTATAPWSQWRPPASWSLEAGDEVEAVVWLRGLDEVIPTYEPREYDEPGHVTVALSIFTGDGSREAENLVARTPVEPLGSAQVSWRYDEVPTDDTEVRSTIPIEASYTFSDNESNSKFTFRVDVHGGRGVQGSPVRVLVQSLEHPSHFEVPGYPWDTMREQQESARAAAECRVRTLQGVPCDEEPGPATNESAPEAGPSLIMPLVALGAAALGTVIVVRRRV